MNTAAQINWSRTEKENPSLYFNQNTIKPHKKKKRATSIKKESQITATLNLQDSQLLK